MSNYIIDCEVQFYDDPYENDVRISQLAEMARSLCPYQNDPDGPFYVEIIEAENEGEPYTVRIRYATDKEILMEDELESLGFYFDDNSEDFGDDDEEQFDTYNMEVDRIRLKYRLGDMKSEITANERNIRRGLPALKDLAKTTIKDDDIFLRNFLSIIDYVDINLDCRVGQKSEINGVKIGYIIRNLRNDKHAGKLSEIKISLLEKIPSWTWREEYDVYNKDKRGIPDRIWMEKYLKLAKCIVYMGPEALHVKRVFQGERIGNFVRLNRANHKSGILSLYRKQKLEALPYWSWEPRKRPFNVSIE